MPIRKRIKRVSRTGGVTSKFLGKTADGMELWGVDEAIQNIGATIDRMQAQEAKKVFMKAGILLRDKAKELHRPHERSGRLMSNIFAAYGDKAQPNVLVGVRAGKGLFDDGSTKGAPHFHIVEFGTVKMSAMPYMRPAISASKAKMAAIIVAGMKRIAEDQPRGN